MRAAVFALVLALVLQVSAAAAGFRFYASPVPSASTTSPELGGHGGGLPQWEGVAVGLFTNLTGEDADGLVVQFSSPITPLYTIGVGAALELVSHVDGELRYAGHVVPYGTWEIDWLAADVTIEYAAWTRNGAVLAEICTRCPTADLRIAGEFAGETFTFDASASIDPDSPVLASFDWTWSDGRRDRGAVVERTFTEPGLYGVELVVADRDGNVDTLTKTFTVSGCAVSIDVLGEGSVSTLPTATSYLYGSRVTLTAVAALGWHFVGWSGDATGSAPSAELTLVGDAAVTATFEIDTFEIAASASEGGSISPAGVTVAPYGSARRYVVAPAAHYHVADVLVDGTSVGPVDSYEFAFVDAAHTIHAVFAIDEHTLVVDIVGSGAVTRTPDAPTYPWGTTVSLAAIAEQGWHFVGWSGDLVHGDAATDIAVDGDKAVTATFEEDLVVTIVERDLIVIRGSSATVTALTAPGASCTIDVLLPSGRASTAAGLGPQTADADGRVSWTWLVAGNTTPGLGAITVTSTAAGQTAQDVVAWTVRPREYSLVVTITGSGLVVLDPDQALYDSGTAVTLTAFPEPGWHLASWGGDASGAENPLIVIVDGDKNVSATFEQDPSGFSVEILDRHLAIRRGTTATLTAQTSPGAACTIVVILPSGRTSTASGLGPKVAGPDGRVSWTWLVAGNTSTGTGSITVTAALDADSAEDTVSWTVTSQ